MAGLWDFGRIGQACLTLTIPSRDVPSGGMAQEEEGAVSDCASVRRRVKTQIGITTIPTIERFRRS